MTGGQDDAAELIDTSGTPIGWTIKSIGDDGSVLCEAPTGHVRRYVFFPTATVAARLRLCRELLKTAVEAWEACAYPISTPYSRRPRLLREWYAKAKEALGDE